MEAGDAARLQNPKRLPKVRKYDRCRWDVLEHGVGVNEPKVPVWKLRQIAAAGVVREGVRDSGQLLPGQGDHFVRNIDSMNLCEEPAHGAKQASGSATDFESPQLTGGLV